MDSGWTPASSALLLFYPLSCSGPLMRPSPFALMLAVAASSLLASQESAVAQGGQAEQAGASSDPFLWLEDVDGARALDWVKTENTRSLKGLEGDPRYADLHPKALELVQANDRI